MKLLAHRSIGLILIIVAFLSAFGIALALTVFQVSRQIDAELVLSRGGGAG